MQLANVSYRELLRDQIVRGPGSGIPVIVGNALKGPVNTPILITNSDQLIEVFGEVGELNESLHLSASQLIKEAGSIYVIRVKGNSELPNSEFGGLSNSCLANWSPSVAFNELTVFTYDEGPGEVFQITGPSNEIWGDAINGFDYFNSLTENGKFYAVSWSKLDPIDSIFLNLWTGDNVEQVPDSINLYVGLKESDMGAGDDEVLVSVSRDNGEYWVTLGSELAILPAPPASGLLEDITYKRVSIPVVIDNLNNVEPLRIDFNKSNSILAVSVMQYCKNGQPMDYFNFRYAR